jgi:hypothetical protein
MPTLKRTTARLGFKRSHRDVAGTIGGEFLLGGEAG